MLMNRKEAIEAGVERLVNGFKQAIPKLENAGVEAMITTLTAIRQKITEQKFYDVKPSDFMPVVVGDNPYAVEQLVWTESFVGDDLEAGIVDYNSNDGKQTRAEVKIDPITVKRRYWSREINYNVLELNTASRAGNFSAISAKERSRFKSWQLLIQKVAFLGLEADGSVKGLLTQDTVNSDTAIITKDIKTMNDTEFQAFLGGIIPAYFTNANNTVYPDTFLIPSDDFNGLGTAVSETFNMKSRLQRIRENCVEITGNADFLVAPLAYCQQENNSLGLNRYVMYRRSDDTSIYMDIPVPYMTTAQDTVNGMNYTSVGYGQFSGCNVLRPLEVLYFDYANA